VRLVNLDATFNEIIYLIIASSRIIFRKEIEIFFYMNSYTCMGFVLYLYQAFFPETIS